MQQSHVVVISGAVGSGKSSTSLLIANHLKQADQRVAVVDIDLVYSMCHPGQGFGPDGWDVTHRASGVLAANLVDQGFDVVVVEGEFGSNEELINLFGALHVDCLTSAYTLDATFAEICRNVASDKQRVGMPSANVSSVRGHFERFALRLPQLRKCTSVVSVLGRSGEEVSREIAERILERRDVRTHRVSSLS